MRGWVVETVDDNLKLSPIGKIMMEESGGTPIVDPHVRNLWEHAKERVEGDEAVAFAYFPALLGVCTRMRVRAIGGQVLGEFAEGGAR